MNFSFAQYKSSKTYQDSDLCFKCTSNIILSSNFNVHIHVHRFSVPNKLKIEISKHFNNKRYH